MKKLMSRMIAIVLMLAMLVSLTGCFDAIDRFLEDDETTSSTQSGTQSDPQNNTGSSSTGSGMVNLGLATGTQSSAAASGQFSDAMVRNKFNNTDLAQSATVLVYMNGSNLESDDGEATEDLSEMVSAAHSSNVNIVVQTMGTKKWNTKYGISSKKTERYLVEDAGLKLVDNSLSQLDCTQAATLLDFINWGVANYPADRYILVFWNHGGGPIYGFGYDEWNSDENAALTLDEMQLAISNSGVKFDFIGMDCCIMSCLETCMAFYDVCDYTILSEEFESGMGWAYKGWMTALAQNPAINTEELAKIVIDDMVSANENSSSGDSSTLACLDEAMIKVLYSAWTAFAYANEEDLLAKNYSTNYKGGTRAVRSDDYAIEDYYITDMMAIAESIDSAESDALASAMANTMVYYRETSDETTLNGMAVTLPYGDSTAYSSLSTIFANCGFEQDYIDWLGKFVSAEGNNSYYDYSDFNDSWGDWDSYEDDYNWSDYDYYGDDSYWDDSSWNWTDWLFSDYWDSDWEDDYWNNDYDDSYWYDSDSWFYDDDYGYYDVEDDSWYDDYDSWFDDWFNDWDDDSYGDYYDGYDFDDSGWDWDW